jgi:signal peptidase II
VRRTTYLSLSVAIIVADWITKLLVVRNFSLYDSRPVIENFFHLVYVRNTGAAFGLGANSDHSLIPFLLNGGAIAIFFAVAFIAFRSPLAETRLQAGLHLILGGAVGNLIDRFRLGYVIDFLDFFVVIGGKQYHWPAFNVADSAICVGIGLLLLDMWRKPEPSEAKA